MVRVLNCNRLLIQEIYKAISYFIERQKLVVKVLKDLDIDLHDMGEWGAAIWSQQGLSKASTVVTNSHLAQTDEFRKALLRARSKQPVVQQGTWSHGRNWIYFLHGKGCRLRNTLTGEVIDWNCPEVEAFDPYFFIEHLKWRLETEQEDSLPEIRKWISDHSQDFNSIIQIIDHMVSLGLITFDWKIAPV